MIQKGDLTLFIVSLKLSLCDATGVAANNRQRPLEGQENTMTTYEIRSPAAAQRYFDQSFVGDVAAFAATIGRALRAFGGVVAHYTKLAHAAEARR
jgi:hypothetical protein